MCEFCVKHGEGKKWYLQASNYSEDLLSDVRRRRMIENFVTDIDSTAKSIERLEQLANAPRFIQRLVKRLVPRKMKKQQGRPGFMAKTNLTKNKMSVATAECLKNWSDVNGRNI
jgi:hypothetical protein